MSEEAEAIKARLKIYDVIGTLCGYSLIIGLCGMAACGIWHAPSWASNTFATAAAVGGILFAFMLMNYSGAQKLLKEAESPRDYHLTH